MNSSIFRRELLHMDVLCVGVTKNFIVAGMGDSLLVYQYYKDTGRTDLKCLFPVFKDERVHDIYVEVADDIIVKGGKKAAYVSIFAFKAPRKGIDCTILWRITSQDWIQDCAYNAKDETLGLVTSHNFYESYDLKKLEITKAYSCGENSLLYSCKIVGKELNKAIVFSGTVFGEIIIWAPSLIKETLIIRRLKGHDGAIFSIAVDIEKSTIITTSDDRSLRVWIVQSDGNDLSIPSFWKSVKIELVHSLYGHTARVWKCLIVSDYFVTGGEDSVLNIWKNDGTLVSSRTLHQEGGIRGLHYSSTLQGLLTAGEDGGINLIKWGFLTHVKRATEVAKYVEVKETFTSKVRFTKKGVVYTIPGGCVFPCDEKEEVFTDDNFLTYSVLEVSKEGEYIFLGSLNGFLAVLYFEPDFLIFNEQIEKGRIYSLHCSTHYLLVCGPEGRLSIFRPTKERLVQISVKILPESLQRWTTCAEVYDDNLVVGDRMGNVHIYSLSGGENVIRTFRKIHGSQGVTDVMITDNWMALTVGRDGTLKTFTENLTQVTTNKLPMETPWKLISYMDDILVVGFSGSCFTVWSTKHRETLVTHDCGGGHRSADVKLLDNEVFFLYVKKKAVFTVVYKLDELTRIRDGFHSKEINSLALLGQRPITIITGGEDTTLRIAYVEDSKLQVTHLMKTHTSSIRTIATTLEMSPHKIVIGSAGGKGQLVLWLYNKQMKTAAELVNCSLKKENPNWRCFVPTDDPFTRFMCVKVAKFDGRHFVAAGCSDRRIRLFKYESSTGLEFICAVQYTHCILNIGIIRSSGFIYVVSMSTNGNVVFWKVIDWSSASKRAEFTLHQSGINSYSFFEIDHDKILFFTGGDDNLLSGSLVTMNGAQIKLKQVWTSTRTHSCQITGLKLLNGLLLTTSIDQKLTVWKWSLEEDDDLFMVFVGEYLSQVADSKGLCAKLLKDGAICVIIYGKGLEMVRVDLRSQKKKAEEQYHCQLLESMFW